MPYTNEVFGLSAGIKRYSYVDRDELDKKFRRYLRRDTHIAIKGPSKSGKSWLRQRCIPDNPIVVQCRLGMTLEDIYRNVLTILGSKISVHTSTEISVTGDMSGKGNVKIGRIAGVEVDGGIGAELSKTFDSDTEYSTSVDNLDYIASEITSSNRKLVIEDFHYLDVEQRKKLAYDLKTLWDYHCFVVIIGVWTQTNLLTFLNPDLTGRIEELTVQWSDVDLKQVIDLGSSSLNIEIDQEIQRSLISDSFGNVGILQSLLLRLIEDQADIEETQHTKSYIVNPDFYNEAAKAYAEQLDGVYQQFAQILSAGIRRRKKSTGIYALTMQAIVEAPDKQLMRGFLRSDIFDITNAKEPRIQKGNLKTVLRKLVELQRPEGGRGLVISYDESIDAVSVVDLQLLFYRKHHTMKWPWEELVEEARQQSLFEEADD